VRIVIESDENHGAAPSAAGMPVEAAPGAALNGGPPPETLVQAMKASLASPEVTEAVGGIDAGPPPEWLTRAIQGAPSPEQ
jgi:hypothetical protein